MKRKHLLVVIAVCFAIITCKADSSLGVQTPELRVVALSGVQTPGVGSLRSFGAPVINALGQTAFSSNEVVVVLRGRQFFSEGSGTLDHVGPGSGQVRLNVAGQTVYEYNDGIFSKKPGEALETIVQSGDQVPGAGNGVVFSAIREVGLSDSGRITFVASLESGGEFSLGIFSHEAGVLTSVVQEGDLSPVPVGPFLNPQFRGMGSHSVNASGQIVFDGGFGIFTIGQTEAVPVTLNSLIESAEFPFNDFRNTPKINASGETAFFGSIPGPGEFGFVQGVYSTGSGALRQVAVEGDQAPGVELGVVIAFDHVNGIRNDSFPNEVLLNDAGQTAFIANLTGENVDPHRAVFSERSGVLELVVRVGDQVPGTEDGLRFFNLPVSWSDLEFNAVGQAAFLAGLSTDQVSQSSAAIFATDLDGQLIEIVRTGDLIDVNDDPLVEDLRTVSFLRFSEELNFFTSNGGSNGGRSSSSLNDSGQLAFSAVFTDGSEAVLVSNRAVFEAFQLGDVNLSGGVDFIDIGPFISILSTGGFIEQADINQDGEVNFLDIGPFIQILSSS